MRVKSSLYVWMDGSLVPEGHARIPVSDSAYLYGVGLFETLRSRNGRVLFPDLHFARLSKNARRIRLRLSISSRQFLSAITSLLRRNRLREATVRLMLSENPDGRPRLVMTAKAFHPYPRRCYEKGARLIVSRWVTADSEPLASTKSISYLSRMLARKEAAGRNADEAVLLDGKGRVTEGASSNLFIIKGGVKGCALTTPPISDGLLPGTRRKVVIRLARVLKIRVVEKTLTVRDLMSADEVFITSTLKDVMPVGFLEKRKIGKTCPGPITQRLQDAYAKRIRGSTPS